MAARSPLENPLVEWLLTDARRIAEPKAFVTALAERFLAHGVEISRLLSGVPILHPQVYSYSARWDLGQGASERFFHLTSERCRCSQPRPGHFPALSGPCDRAGTLAPEAELS
jgi:hypothetical protein